jgi:hypothetical protein
MNRFVSTAAVAAVTLMAMASQLIPVAPTQAAANADQRVKEALDKTGWKYEVDKDGDFKVGIKMKDGRTQIGYIISKTDKVKGLEVRRIVSVGYVAQGDLNGNVAIQLLKASSQNSFGAWQVSQNKDKTAAVFASKVNANMPPEDLDVALMANLYSADQMEQQLTNKDAF